ncbi:MAG: dTDP-4-dehydrorhamnose 3,5-epimerase [SAR324 cluster bacterium]|nr:dTDP-4-dehydrorhamnose 3,5-epimerase [SAR324 cluster bacterium]
MSYEQVTPTNLADVLLLEPKVFSDERGFFLESFNQRDFEEAIRKSVNFVQDNHSCSQRGVLRGLHFQIRHPQAKLVRVTHGEVFDVVVDLRRSSPCFGQHTCTRLSSVNRHQLWIPPGFAHGFLVVSSTADLVYKCTNYYEPKDQKSIRWNDPEINIDWPLENRSPIISKNDESAVTLNSAQVFP